MAGKRRQPGTGSLYKRKSDGMWIGAEEITTANGDRRRKTVSSRDRNECIRKKAELRKLIDSGRIPTAPSTTVAKWLEYWLEFIVTPNVSPATLYHYEQSCKLIVPRLGRKRIDRLTVHDVRAMILDIQETSTRNAQKAHGALKTALKAAEAEGVVARNVAAAEPPPKHEAKERDPFPFDVAQHIIKTALQIFDPMWASRWAAAFVTGGRPAELRGLRRQFVNITGEEIDFAWQLKRNPRTHGCADPTKCRAKQAARCPEAKFKAPAGYPLVPCHGSLAFTKPKTKAGTRIVPLVEPMPKMFETLFDWDTGPNPHNLVWHWADGLPFTPEQELEQWAVLMRAAGLVTIDENGAEVMPEVPYSARHSTATLLLKAGVAESTRMKIIGHSSVAAQRIYAHEDRELARAAMDNLTGLIELPSAET